MGVGLDDPRSYEYVSMHAGLYTRHVHHTDANHYHSTTGGLGDSPFFQCKHRLLGRREGKKDETGSWLEGYTKKYNLLSMFEERL